MKKLFSFFIIICLATFLASCGATPLKNSDINKTLGSNYTLPDNSHLDFNSIADEIISSDSIDGIRVGTTYKSLMVRYGEPISKSSENKTISGSLTQEWQYDDMGADYFMVKSHDDYIINSIKIYGKSPFSTERDIKIGSPADNVVKAYRNQINNDLSNENIIVVGTQEKGMLFTLTDGKVTSIFIGYTNAK